MVCAHGRIGTSSAPAHHATTKPLGTATNPTNIASSTRTATGLRSRQRPQSSNPPPLSEWGGKNVLQLLFASAGLAFGTDIKRQGFRLLSATCLSQNPRDLEATWDPFCNWWRSTRTWVVGSFEFQLARFLYGPRFFGSSVASSKATISSISPVSGCAQVWICLLTLKRPDSLLRRRSQTRIA